MSRTVLTTLAMLLLAVVLLLVALRWLEPHLIYFPVRAVEHTPRDAGLAYRDVTLDTADGETLHAWWVPAQDSALPPLLFFHGNAGNREHRLHNVLGLHRTGIPVLIFDYRGYGGSSGRPSEQGLVRDGEAAFDWLRREVGPRRPIVLFGRSLGAAVAAQVALRRPAEALVLESVFTSVPAMARRTLLIPGIGRLARTRFDTLAAVRRLRLPLLMIHGEADEIVPFAMGRRVFRAAASPDKSFHAVAGGSHNDTYLVAGEAYWRWLRDFLAAAARASGSAAAGGAGDERSR